MGSLGDNLLKLTEFPFSYSLISLLVLMYLGEGVFSLESETLAPLLILMGFVATTLSITDPIGALQKAFLKGRGGESSKSMRRRESEEVKNEVKNEEFNSLSLFGERNGEFFRSNAISASLAYKFLINAPKGGSVKLDDYSIEKMDNHNRWLISYAVLSLRDSTLRTIWVRREIDKITAMIYFIIVILTFILALFLHQDFQNKFLAALQGDNQTGSGDGETISSDGGTVASEQGQEEQQLRQSVQEVAATGTATTQTTGKDLVIRHLRAAIAAAQANDNETAMAEIDSALEALSQREDEGDQWARLMIIGGFSLIALGAVSYMVYRRLRHLRQYARTAFQYLMTQLAYRTTRRTIKIEDLTFKESLQEVQRLILSQNKEITLQDLLIIFKENVLDRNGQYNDLRPVITTPKQVNVTDAEGTTISTTEGLLAEWQFTSFGPAKLFSLVVLTPDKNTGYTVAIQGRPASEMPTIPPEVQQIMNSFELVVT